MAGGNIGHKLQFKGRGDILTYLVKAATHIYRGSMVCINTANGYAYPGADTANFVFVGFAEEEADNTSGADGAKSVRCRRNGIVRIAKTGGTVAITEVGSVVCCDANQTVSQDQTCEPLATATNKIIVGTVVGVDTPEDFWWVAIWALGVQNLDVSACSTTTELALTTNGHGADNIGLYDAGSLVTATNVADAIQEAYVGLKTAQAFLNLPLGSFTLDDGTAIADFANDASPTPGWAGAAETVGIRWNNYGTPGEITIGVPYPPDLNAGADVVIHFLAAKTGATVGDAVTFTVVATEAIDAALYDADADFGGVSSAMTGDALAKTCQEETLTLAAANVNGSPGVLTLRFGPTDGTLGTDDVILFGVWLEYTRSVLTS
jgi:hypothetical protein